MFMRKVVLVIALTAAAPGWGETTPSEAWQTTDLDFEFTKTFINNDKCHSTPEYSAGCKRALNAVLDLVKLPPFEVIANDFDFEGMLWSLSDVFAKAYPQQRIWGAAINELLASFDPHAYLRPTADTLDSREESFSGVGFSSRPTANGHLVYEVFRGSPAAAAGLKVGDRVTAVGEADHGLLNVIGKSSEQFQRLVLGPARSIVHLALTQGEGHYKTVKIPRQNIVWPNIEFHLLNKKSNIGFIRLRKFTPGAACSGVRKALRELSRQKAVNFILDLRGNSGGSLEEALCINGLFVGMINQVDLLGLPVVIPRADLVRVFDLPGELVPHATTELNPQRRPLAVLMDDRSASSSEVVAGVLQHYQAAWIVGQRSFGKGTGQVDETVENHSSLSIGATVAQLYFPNKKSNQRVGITPSFPVPIVLGLGEHEIPSEREEDFYPNAFAAANEPWPDERKDAIERIRECIGHGRWDKYFLKRMDYANGDYTRAYAAAVLKCAK